VGDGENLVPTIHVRDLARFVKRVAEQKPESPYIFAVDRTADPRQRSIIEGIARGMGSGEVEQNDAPKRAPLFALKRASYNEARNVQASWVHTLQIALKVRPSALVVKQDEEGKEEDLEFEWHSREGLAANIKKVAQEYCEVNNLRPIKIYVNGPPLSGKTTLCKEYKHEVMPIDLPNATTSYTSPSPMSPVSWSICLPMTG
jgi:adenylate kinase